MPDRIELRPPTYVSRMDGRGRIVLRKAMREKLGMPQGGRVELYINEDGVLAIASAKARND